MSTLAPDTVVSPQVRLGNSSAYAFDGDVVRLDAELILAQAAPTAASRWSLQLWADADSDGGIKLAEVALEQLFPDAHGRAHVCATTAAHPPAGGRKHTISLSLAENAGPSSCIVDRVSYPRNETFVLPRLDGDVTHRIDGAQVEVRVPCIRNPRGADNLSGTLALELWALPAAYHGGAFSGIALGSILLGTLAGQRDWQDVHTRLPIDPLPAGNWHLVLMLREWTAAGYLARDYRNLAPSIEVAAHAADVAVVAEPAAVADTAVVEDVAAAAVAAEAEAAAKAAKPVKKAAAGRNARATMTTEPARLSINGASKSELAAIKGLSKRLAEGIVAGRPWTSVDDLISVKGIGPKLLERIRKALQA